jgi:hypothetical protein
MTVKNKYVINRSTDGKYLSVNGKGETSWTKIQGNAEVFEGKREADKMQKAQAAQFPKITFRVQPV